MADTGNTTEGQAPESTDAPETPTEPTDVTPADTEQVQQPVEAAEPDKWAGIPEDHWVRSELESARSEAARKRIEARELKEKLEGSKSADEVQQIVNEYNDKVTQAELRADKLTAGREFDLPKELVARLQGSTLEELMADAQSLASFASKVPRTAPPLPPSGGRNPREGSDEPTPEELYAKTQKSHQRRF